MQKDRTSFSQMTSNQTPEIQILTDLPSEDRL